MIHVRRGVVGPIAALLTQRSACIDQIDLRVSRAKLSKTSFARAALQLAAKHILVKRNHVLKIVDADDHMIDVRDIDGIRLFHDGFLSIDSV